MDTRLEVIDAFVDGERVDATELKAALADAGGRDYLVDAWLLREALHGEPAGVPAAAPATAARPGWLNPRPWMVAAAFAGAVLGGYAIGYGTAGRATPPPVNSGAAAVTSTPTPAAFPVPLPTRVIQLEFQSSPVASGGD